MIRLVFLTNPDIEPSSTDSLSLANQQIKGFRYQVMNFLNTKSDNVMEMQLHSGRNEDVNAFVNDSFLGHIICVASGTSGLSALNALSQKINAHSDRHKWFLIWLNDDYDQKLKLDSCQIDLAILPIWKRTSVINEFLGSSISFKLFFDCCGIYDDMQRHYRCFEPLPNFVLSTEITEDTKLVGLCYGGHLKGSLLPFDDITHWIAKIHEYEHQLNKQLFYVLMNSPATLELPDKGKAINQLIKKQLNELNVPYIFIHATESINHTSCYAMPSDEDLKKIPMVINYIESHKGSLYVTGDDLGRIYHILGSTQSFITPSVRVLVPKNPQTSGYIDNDFFDEHKTDWYPGQHNFAPWITINSDAHTDHLTFDEDISKHINDHINKSLITEEIPEVSFWAKLCSRISTFGLFKEKKNNTRYQEVSSLSKTQHGQPLANSEVSNPMNEQIKPIFTIE